MTTHRDCRNYAPVDVTKGVCHRTKEIVQADGASCGEFQLLPRCGNCARFEASASPEMGACGASTAEPKFFAYPAMAAVTCESYRPL
jgi:4-hydroxyphenylacetate decarboxylase small subunit